MAYGLVHARVEVDLAAEARHGGLTRLQAGLAAEQSADVMSGFATGKAAHLYWLSIRI